MKKLLLLFSLLGLTSISFGQAGHKSSEAEACRAFGNYALDLSKGVVSSAYQEDWTKTKKDWNKNARNVKNLTEAKSILVALENALKPNSFTSGFIGTKQNWIKNVSEAKSINELASLTKFFIKSISPAFLTKDFNLQKDDFISHLGSIR